MHHMVSNQSCHLSYSMPGCAAGTWLACWSKQHCLIEALHAQMEMSHHSVTILCLERATHFPLSIGLVAQTFLWIINYKESQTVKDIQAQKTTDFIAVICGPSKGVHIHLSDWLNYSGLINQTLANMEKLNLIYMVDGPGNTAITVINSLVVSYKVQDINMA